jgi:hypothetical protein
VCHAATATATAMWCGWCQSKRAEETRRLVPLPASHCHSPCHKCHDYTHCRLPPKNLQKKIKKNLHCHPATATATATQCIWYHSNRTDLFYRLIPLPPSHCHSPCHKCHNYTTDTQPPPNHKKKKIAATQPPPQPQPHALPGTKMTALMRRVDWSHCHPATATPHATRTLSPAAVPGQNASARGRRRRRGLQGSPVV